MRVLLAVLLTLHPLLTPLSTVVEAQAGRERETFEVASIKINRSASGEPSGIRGQPSGPRVTMQQLAGRLSRLNSIDRPVVDRTGLTGEFDLAAGTTADMVAPTGHARLLIALREQLGLTLRAEEGSFEVLRVRRIEQPSPN